MFETKRFDERNDDDRMEEFSQMTSDWDEFRDDDVRMDFDSHIEPIKLDPQY
jgi:hypothetical protein